MRMILAVAAFASLAATQTAAAAEWYLVGGNQQTRTYVDLSSLRPLGGKIVGDVLSIYAEPIGDPKIIYGSKIRQEFDCPGKYFRTLEYSYYKIDGSLISTEPSETINENRTAKPGSINEGIIDFACYRKGGNIVGDPFQDADSAFDDY